MRVHEAIPVRKGPVVWRWKSYLIVQRADEPLPQAIYRAAQQEGFEAVSVCGLRRLHSTTDEVDAMATVHAVRPRPVGTYSRADYLDVSDAVRYTGTLVE